MISIPTNKLKAALTHAAVKDIRHYLNGVLVEINSEGTCVLVATDGARAFISTLFDVNMNAPKLTPMEIIIPVNVVKTAIRGLDHVVLAQSGGNWQLGAMNFSPLDGKFPDWRRIVPQSASLTGEPGDFNWQFVADAESALRIWQNRKNATVRLRTAGASGAAVMVSEATDAFCVIMPTRARAEFADAFHVPR